MSTKPLPEADLQAAFALKNEYLDDQPWEEFAQRYAEYGDLFVGLYESAQLIGLCYGWPFAAGGLVGDKIILQGIAVAEPHNARGRGGLLLAHFERQVAARGPATISLGSAGGYVEGFYLKNGYQPYQYMARLSQPDWSPEQLPPDMPIDDFRHTADETIVYLPAPVYEPERKALIEAALGAYEVIFIFEKQV